MTNLFDLTGKKAVVIGGGGGIGKAIATGLVSYGAEVVISSRNERTLEEAAAEIAQATGKAVSCIAADASDETSIKALADACMAKFGTIDILVNSQGVNIKSPTVEMPTETWDEMFAVNVRSMMLSCREFGRIMVAKRSGKIINVSSIRGIRAVIGGGGNTGYGATKGAVDMLTKGLAAEWAQYNVQVNAIGPVITDTPMMEKVFAQNPQLKPNLLRNIPMGRIGVTEDNIGPAVFLASAASDFVTGQVIYPDGGSACVI
ncbi:MAG: SDR family oxidoreductase [Oscillospiraceae bacterium]|nr:SDR family oxidoreductase [Oscillospiraceae bacterium]